MIILWVKFWEPLDANNKECGLSASCFYYVKLSTIEYLNTDVPSHRKRDKIFDTIKTSKNTHEAAIIIYGANCYNECDNYYHHYPDPLIKSPCASYLIVHAAILIPHLSFAVILCVLGISAIS